MRLYRVNASMAGLHYGEVIEIDTDDERWAALIEHEVLSPLDGEPVAEPVKLAPFEHVTDEAESARLAALFTQEVDA